MEVDGQPFETASEARLPSMERRPGDGGFSWPIRHRAAQLGAVRREYIEAMVVDSDEDDQDDNGDDDEL
ncbi:hypothetical protein ABIB06_005235 [Bradyrhizobium sp. LB8.2]|uniref:hypothetical protein n=1 Tax=unclassified Bradyrhizobium TaxID=2631580 RepID=UPI001FF7355D|nr:hypothetical protein [Bradyrhizobium sp. 197]MCK1477169.1 hypothetical protein [Bradyrhizobium sp. 197]